MSVTAATVQSRLNYWNQHPVPHGYDESNYSTGPDGHSYRNDCSGYVSMLTGMVANPYTGAMVGSAYSTPITKSQLRFGDIMIAVAGNGWSAGHVVLFDHWTDTSHYLGHEFGWGAAPAHRVIEYPYSDPDGGQDSRNFNPRRLRVVTGTADVPGSYTVQPGDTLSDVGQQLNIPWETIAADNGITAPYTIYPGQVLKLTGGVTATGGDSVPVPKPAPKPAPRYGPMHGAPVPAIIRQGTGNYYGSYSGGVQSRGGFNVSERPAIKLIQQQLIYLGYVPGVTDINSDWADGIFDNKTDKPGTGPTSQAVARFQRAHMPNTRFYGQVWFDDWAKLATL